MVNPENNRQTTRVATRLFSAMLVLVVLAVTLFQPSAIKPASAATCVKYHVVQAGDTLSNIAQTYGVKTEDLASANNLTSPYVIYIGQSLCIPASTTATTGTTTTTTTTSTSKQPTLLILNFTRKVYIQVTNFPKNTTYYVRAGNREDWVRIGRLRTNKDGKATDVFNVPAVIDRTSNLTICLKNVITEVVVCQTILR